MRSTGEVGPVAEAGLSLAVSRIAITMEAQSHIYVKFYVDILYKDNTILI